MVGWLLQTTYYITWFFFCTPRMHSDIWLCPDRNVDRKDAPLRFKSFQKHLVDTFTLILSFCLYSFPIEMSICLWHNVFIFLFFALSFWNVHPAVFSAQTTLYSPALLCVATGLPSDHYLLWLTLWDGVHFIDENFRALGLVILSDRWYVTLQPSQGRQLQISFKYSVAFITKGKLT